MLRFWRANPTYLNEYLIEAVNDYQFNLNLVLDPPVPDNETELWDEEKHVALLTTQTNYMLLMDYARQFKVPVDLEIQGQMEALYQQWRNHLTTDFQTVKQKVNNHYYLAVLEEYRIWLEDRTRIYDITEYDLWLEERDIMELIIISATEEFQTKEYAEAIQPFDQKMKVLIEHCLNLITQPPDNREGKPRENYPDWKVEYFHECRIDWLPKRFWWRHLPTPA